jgi:hypothetical protein
MANVMTIDGGGGVAQGVRVNEREKLIRYNFTLSGSYVQFVRGTNTGELLVPNNAVGVNAADQYWGQRGPSRGYVLNIGSSGFSMSILPGADNLHWLLAIFSGVATQLSAGTYAANAANLLTDLDLYVEFSGRRFD